MSFTEHKREVFSVAWSPTSKDVFASSSWDGTVKLWSPTRDASLVTLPVGSCTYSVCFSPLSPQVLSAVSSDSCLRIFDLRVPVSAKYHLVASLATHATPAARYLAAAPNPRYPGAAAVSQPGWPSDPAELLTHDWNKYRSAIVATGGVDRMVRIFDVRFTSPAMHDYPRAPPPGTSIMQTPSAVDPSVGGPGLSVLKGHGYAIRRLAWSPHHADILLTASYDMTARVWLDEMVDVQRERQQHQRQAGVAAPDSSVQGSDPQLGVMNRHTEFVTGVDWCLFGMPGWVATVGWDERLLLWDANAFIRR